MNEGIGAKEVEDDVENGGQGREEGGRDKGEEWQQ